MVLLINGANVITCFDNKKLFE